MAIVAVPYHLDVRLDDFTIGMSVGDEVTVQLPPGAPWERMAVLYEQVAQMVSSRESPPLVVSGDCTTSLGVIAGLQRAGKDAGVVWFDALADFHTEATATSGYLGGMPLALAVGVGTLTLPTALGFMACRTAEVRGGGAGVPTAQPRPGPATRSLDPHLRAGSGPPTPSHRLRGTPLKPSTAASTSRGDTAVDPRVRPNPRPSAGAARHQTSLVDLIAVVHHVRGRNFETIRQSTTQTATAA